MATGLTWGPCHSLPSFVPLSSRLVVVGVGDGVVGHQNPPTSSCSSSPSTARTPAPAVPLVCKTTPRGNVVQRPRFRPPRRRRHPPTPSAVAQDPPPPSPRPARRHRGETRSNDRVSDNDDDGRAKGRSRRGRGTIPSEDPRTRRPLGVQDDAEGKRGPTTAFPTSKTTTAPSNAIRGRSRPATTIPSACKTTPRGNAVQRPRFRQRRRRKGQGEEQKGGETKSTDFVSEHSEDPRTRRPLGVQDDAEGKRGPTTVFPTSKTTTAPSNAIRGRSRPATTVPSACKTTPRGNVVQ
ncbi:hypothetical protein BXZ70DRAFT_1013194 [Cristinia sonorae]|uniref:Uncharacterized protein n=1 Tax=Cristinia sonorae TaxID=1940300 RepID=A0A8K0XJH4_9AGAR|nr:hypothetical protein BXZ70DRAFT_1013194 [Cristinia sonorae]